MAHNINNHVAAINGAQRLALAAGFTFIGLVIGHFYAFLHQLTLAITMPRNAVHIKDVP